VLEYSPNIVGFVINVHIFPVAGIVKFLGELSLVEHRDVQLFKSVAVFLYLRKVSIVRFRFFETSQVGKFAKVGIKVVGV